MQNYYQILGVSEMATLPELKSAYKRLAKAYHPDINSSPTSEEKFKQISAAYIVLSNHDSRQLHDVKLAQMRLDAKKNSVRVEESRQRNYRSPIPGYRYRPAVYSSTYDKNTERKGTYYALGIVFSIAVLVYTVVSLNEYYLEYKLQNRISQFDRDVKQADSLFYSGKIKAALNFIQNIKSSNHEYYAIKQYEIDYLNFRREQADIDYRNGAYQDALWGYLFFMEYSSSQNPDMQYKLAVCYRNLKQPKKAVYILNELMNNNYKRMRMIALIAEIFKEDLEDTEVAMQYYEMGLESIQAEFKSIYGDAYRLLVSKERTPESYKSIYVNAAEILYAQANYSEAAKLLEWVIFFRPSQESAYRYLVDCYYKLGEKKEACTVLKKAEKLNIPMELNFELSCN